MDDAVESYLTELARIEHDEPVLVEMEARAADYGFPIVGRATGRFRELAARAGGSDSAEREARLVWRPFGGSIPGAGSQALVRRIHLGSGRCRETRPESFQRSQ
jgi:hypothetical protein